jgi:6-pyruvoyltetrahydropterin/6-carboxytetrahydropterin synthase
MKMFVTKEFTFAAAHSLSKYHGKCERLHGHNYRLRVTVQGQVQSNGMLIDFVILKKIVKDKVFVKYDHQNLDEFFVNSTAENVAQAIWDDLVDLPALLKAELEDPNMPDEIAALLAGDDEAKKDINLNVSLFEIKLWETDSSSVTIQA